MVNDAIRILTFDNKKPSMIIKKLVESAVANADQKQVIDVDNLYIKEIMVDKGPFIEALPCRAPKVVPLLSRRSLATSASYWMRGKYAWVRRLILSV
jgi:hypothetical protein